MLKPEARINRISGFCSFRNAKIIIILSCAFYLSAALINAEKSG